MRAESRSAAASRRAATYASRCWTVPWRAAVRSSASSWTISAIAAHDTEQRLPSYTGSRVKLLFVLRHPTAVRSLHGVFRLLAAHGHEVHLAYGRAKFGDAHRALQQIAAESPGLTFDRLPRPAPDDLGWSRLTEDMRL